MSARFIKEGGAKVNPFAWMLTFSDMITLLLTFFVMLLTMSSMDISRLQKVVSSFTGGQGVLYRTDVGRIISYQEKLKELSRLSLEQLPKEEVLREVFLQQGSTAANSAFEPLPPEVQVKKQDRGVSLIFGTDIFFEPGQAEVRPEAMGILRTVAEIIKQVNRPVSIEGHTDPSEPAQTAWDLSLNRALAVRKILVEEMGANPWRIRIAALADSRPLAGSATEEGRAKNRRLEIFFDWLE